MTPPQDEEEAFTYEAPQEKKEYLDAITLELEIDIDSNDGNINTEQMREILRAIIKTQGCEEIDDIDSMNKPTMAKEIANLLNFEFLKKYVNFMVSEV